MMDRFLETIARKIQSGQRLSAGDGQRLFDPSVNLHAVGQWADHVRRRKNGNVVYYNINAHLNPTNICVYRCPLCAYSCNPGDPAAYRMGLDEILAQAEEAARHGCTELHITGGVHPKQPYAWYLQIIRQLHQAYPQLHLKAWTAVEIAWFAEITSRPVRAVLEEMIEAGLGSLPGGGAEILDPSVRHRIAPKKPSPDVWLDVHRTAHSLGLRSNATMLYGHGETIAQRVNHLIRLRTLQDETGGFQAFVPLAFHPGGTQLAHLAPPSALDDLRVMAASRLLLDNFPHLKAYWISLGIGTAQTALAYGADDLDGTVRHERIHHAAGSETPEMLSVETLCQLIREAGREPVQRDTLYRPVSQDNRLPQPDGDRPPGGPCVTGRDTGQ